MYGNHCIAFYTIFMKEVRRFLKLWAQTILPSVITTALYFLIFGNLIGARIGLMENLTYTQFITPGLIMMTVITNAYANVSSSLFSEKFFRSLEDQLISPIPNSILLLGYLSGGILRGVAVAICVTLTALFFTHFSIQNYGVVIIAILLSATLFSLAGFLNALYAKNFDAVAFIPTFFLTPLTYLGGVFYSIHMLPPFWQKVSLLNPIVYLVNLFRWGMFGVSDVNIGLALLLASALIIILFTVSLLLLRKGVGVKG